MTAVQVRDDVPRAGDGDDAEGADVKDNGGEADSSSDGDIERDGA
jgi:hypothetical protein